MKAHRMLLFLFVTTQVLGFTFLWSWLPDQSEQTITPDQFASAVFAELEELQNTQQHSATGGGTMAINFPEAETFRTAIRAILKEELSAVLENQTMANSAAFASGEPVNSMYAQSPAQATVINERPLTQEQAQRRETSMTTSRNILEQAIAAGDWSMEDTATISRHVDNLSPAQRIELLEQFHDALGKGSLKMDGPPPPL